MSEKHLTEAPWKAMVLKQSIKDIGLQKALAAYAKLDATKTPAPVLEALKDISELALKLKKANPAKEEVVDHLDEVLKEIKRTIPVVEAKLKSVLAAAEDATAKPATPPKPAADEEDDAAEAEEFKKDLKKQMLSALAQVKQRAPGDPQEPGESKPQLKFMAYIAGKACAVIIARRVGTATKKLLGEILHASSGKALTGECIFENNAHTFVLDTVPGGLAKKLAGALHSETGVRCKVRVRSADGLTTLDSDTDVDPEETPAPAVEAPSPASTPAPPPADPRPNAEEQTKFLTRFKALQPDLLKAVGTKTPAGDQIRLRATEAGALAGKKDFAQAHRVLDALEVSLRQVLEASPAPPAATANPPAAPPPPMEGAAPRKQIKLSTYLTGRSNLRTARENAARELQRLQQIILAKAADEAFFKEVEAKSQRLFDYLAPIDDEVVNRLDEAGRCTDLERQDEFNAKVRQSIQKQLTSLRNHPLSGFIEKNPFGKFIIKQPLEVTLSALDKQLS